MLKIITIHMFTIVIIIVFTNIIIIIIIIITITDITVVTNIICSAIISLYTMPVHKLSQNV